MKRHVPPGLPWSAISLLLLSLAMPAAKLDPASEEFYHMARFFMTRNEEKIFRGLPTPELRGEFIEAFWEIRDPDPDSGENESRTELEARFEFVNKYLREANHPGWDTARGMVYLVLGPPSMMDAGSTPFPADSPPGTLNVAGEMAGTVVWPYLEQGIYVYFIDRQGFGVYELDMINTSPRLLALLKAGKTRFIRDGEKGAEDRFLEFKAEIEPANDRLRIVIPIRELHFDIDTEGGYSARIHLAVNLFLPDGSIVTQKDNRRIAIDPEMQKKGQLQVVWTLALKKGKNLVDLLVLDQVAGKSNRRFFSVKKR